MAKDFTKYSIVGIAQGLGKARLVFEIVKDYTAKINPSFEEPSLSNYNPVESFIDTNKNFKKIVSFK